MPTLFLITLYLVLIIIITVAVLYAIINYKSPPKDYAPSILDLSQENIPATSYEVKENLLLPGASSLIIFLNIRPGDKTANMDGSMRQLVNVGGVLNFEVSPVSRSVSHDYLKSGNTLNTTAQIRVATYGESGFEVEQITLPDVPMQKWFCLGIVREGRRIDVIYDDKIVASKRLKNNIPNQPYGGLRIPSKDQNNRTGLLGNIQHIFLVPHRMNAKEIGAIRSQYIKPDGELSTKLSLPIPFFNLDSSSLNIDASISSPTTPPANSLKKWQTPYN